MLSREDFIFTIGYDGPSAVVDKHARNKYGKLNTRELAEKGLFRAAYSSAVYSGNPDELKFVADAYNRLGKNLSPPPAVPDYKTADLPDVDIPALERLFGVSRVDVKRFILI